MRERVFLIGMMGCGKTTVGARLSERLAISYLDNDALLAEREGDDLMGLAAKGATQLHDAERAFAEDLARATPPFIAGIAASVVEYPDTIERLRAAGFITYLAARPETLLARVTATVRPWLEEDPLGWIRTTLARRGPLFGSAAHLVVETDAMSPEDIAETIASAISARELGRGA